MKHAIIEKMHDVRIDGDDSRKIHRRQAGASSKCSPGSAQSCTTQKCQCDARVQVVAITNENRTLSLHVN
jgi:hypothetical protein